MGHLGPSTSRTKRSLNGKNWVFDRVVPDDEDDAGGEEQDIPALTTQEEET